MAVKMKASTAAILSFLAGLTIWAGAVGAAWANDFFVPPVEGAPPPFDERLARLVTEALIRIDIPATNDSAAQEGALYVVKGKATAAGVENGTRATIDWTIEDVEGNALSILSVTDIAPYMSAQDPWAAFDLSSLKRLASKTADEIEASQDSLESAAVTVPSSNAATTESFGRIAIGPITGAPGDGNEALALALAQVLRQYRVTVEANPSPGVYVTKATVSIMDNDADTQTVRIAWDLEGPNGRRYGVVEQENQVPHGSLRVQWGDVAVYAAAAAGDGIVALMQQLGTTPPNVND